MAALNVLSPRHPPTPSFPYLNNSFSCGGAYCKLRSLSYSNNCVTLRSSLFARAKSSQSDNGCSWMQESSMRHNTAAGNERRRGPLYSVFPAKPAEVSNVQDLYEFICSGPLVEKAGLMPDSIAESIDKWLAYGSYLCRLFGSMNCPSIFLRKLGSITTIYQCLYGVKTKFPNI